MSYTYDQKKVLCDKLTSLSTPSLVKEIFTTIQDYATLHPSLQVKQLGGKIASPFMSKKCGDDYIFEIDNLPEELLQTIEKLLESE